MLILAVLYLVLVCSSAEASLLKLPSITSAYNELQHLDYRECVYNFWCETCSGDHFLKKNPSSG